MKMRAPVDFELAGGQPVTPFAQRIGRQGQRRGVFAYAHATPVHRLNVHRPERLHGAIAHVRGHAKASSLTSSQPVFSLFAAQFRLIFREFPCGLLADELLQPTPKRILRETLLTTISADPKTASTPRFDVQQPPPASRLVLEVFRSHRRISTAAENPKWNDITRGGRCAETRRLPPARLGEIKGARRSKPQAIDLAWVLTCRSVGARAAPKIFAGRFKHVFGTVGVAAFFEVRP
ncbi:hypothetical protein [Bradyrhizobium sp. C9]|uniref:hypothetical protein n=1 Tax=Bradyrhizobium sp. C9 TaxID=142585 RepID=UPI0013041C68|nr:hypothetical protein [Bradyrhizobium sp. C9]